MLQNFIRQSHEEHNSYEERAERPSYARAPARIVSQISSPALGTSGILKREGQQQYLSHLIATLYQHKALAPAKGVRTMGTLLLNARIVRQHPTSTPKNSKHFASYLLAILTRRAKTTSSNQPAPKKLASILLPICLLIELYLSGIPGNQPAQKNSKHFASYLLAIIT